MNQAQRRSKGHRDHGVRARLVSATRRCVRDEGVAETSSRAIAQAAGVNLAAITYYFGSKDELIEVALAEELREWTQPALEHLAQAGDPVQRLLNAVNALNEVFDAQREHVSALLEIFVLAARDRDSRNPIVAIWSQIQAQLVAVITELRSSGVVPSWADAEAMASLIMAVVAGTVVNEAVDSDGAGHRAVALQFANLLISAAADTRSTPAPNKRS